MRRTPIHVTLVLAAMAAALTGCSQLPTAPRPETLAPAVVSPESAPVVISQTDDPHPPGELGRSGLDTITLDVGQSGAVRAGRFTLFIHKNSLKQPATIVMSQPDPNVMQVEFTVTPADANNFQVPLKLVADCSGQDQATIDNETTYWWDGMWTVADKQTVSQVGTTIVAQCQTLTSAKIDVKVGKNTMSN
jgi:hypothetical protein